MSKEKRTARIFILLFLSLSLLPSMGMLIFGGSKAGANEILAPRPHFVKNGSVNTAYLSDLSAYVSDRFFLRQEAITLRNRLSAGLFATSPNEKVALGRQGWLFYAEPLVSEPLTEREAWCAAENLRLIQEAAEEKGSAFLFVLCPNKSTLCPDKLRSGSPSEDGELLEGLLGEKGVAFCSLYDVLQGREELFYATDSHWNALGAAAAAERILAGLGREASYPAAAFTTDGVHAGDLSEMLYPAAPVTEPAHSYPFTYRYTSAYRAPNDPTITAEGTGSGTLFCYRDSFGNDLHPFLAEDFAASTFSRKAAFDLTGLEADVLLIEIVERNIDHLYTYDHTYPAPARQADISAAVPAAPLTAKTTEAGELTRISGKVEDADCAPLYLLCGGKLYACAPRPDGFSLCLPELAGELSLVYQKAGVMYIAPLTVQ